VTTLLLTLVALAVVGVVAVLVGRGDPLIVADPVEARALDWPLSDPVEPQDLLDVRFTVAVRGYRMDEVDRVLEDVRVALALRDERIADLLAERGAPAGDQPEGTEPSTSPPPR
jgi:DivIVA domain-containing protein